MRALTLYRPWPWALFHAPADRIKDVENREWSAHWIIREQVAIHAGQYVDRPAFDFIEKVCDVRPPEDGGPTGIIGVVRFDDMLEASESPWFTGPIGWKVGTRQAVYEPIPCPGARKLWNLPPDVEALLKERLATTPRRRRRRGDR